MRKIQMILCFYENNNSIFIAYANLGLQATYSRAFAGISVADIPLSNNTPVVNGIEPSPTRFYLNAGYDWEITEGFSVEPSVMMNLNTNSSRMFRHQCSDEIVWRK